MDFIAKWKNRTRKMSAEKQWKENVLVYDLSGYLIANVHVMNGERHEVDSRTTNKQKKSLITAMFHKAAHES